MWPVGLVMHQVLPDNCLQVKVRQGDEHLSSDQTALPGLWGSDPRRGYAHRTRVRDAIVAKSRGPGCREVPPHSPRTFVAARSCGALTPSKDWQESLSSTTDRPGGYD